MDKCRRGDFCGVDRNPPGEIRIQGAPRRVPGPFRGGRSGQELPSNTGSRWEDSLPLPSTHCPPPRQCRGSKGLRMMCPQSRRRTDERHALGSVSGMAWRASVVYETHPLYLPQDEQKSFNRRQALHYGLLFFAACCQALSVVVPAHTLHHPTQGLPLSPLSDPVVVVVAPRALQKPLLAVRDGLCSASA
ncbi:unnamed protein product [Arctogadus glacialis]